MYGFTGKVLRVDLTSRQTKIEQPPLEWYQKYLGGKGMGYRYLLEDLAPHTEPLGPDNEIIFATGPLAGTLVPTSSRLAVVTKSPATGTILVSLIGGSIAAEIKYAGYDGLIIQGTSACPVFLYVTDERVTIENATSLWGKGVHETEEIIKSKKWTYQAATLTIGPAGERMVPYACITSDSYHQAGRGGSGAVMGSKNLKAVVVKGKRGITVPNMTGFLEKILEIRSDHVLTPAHLWTDTDGTPMVVDVSQAVGILPTRNFTQGQYEKVDQINSDAVKQHFKRPRACFSCPLGCGRFTKAHNGTVVEGPEYETIALAGSNCDVGTIDGLIRFNKLCDDYGLDTMSTGAVLAFAMEATEKGIYDFGITFGDADKMLEYVTAIAFRQGVGELLSTGVKALADKLNCHELALEVKGLEFPGYDPRGSYGLALAYATSDRGACHQRAFPAEEDAFGPLDPFTFDGKASLVKKMQDFNSVKDSLIICDMWRPSAEMIAEIFSELTRMEMTAAELERCGERIWNVGRLFNSREGFSRIDDTLPYRIFNEALPSGRAAGKLMNEGNFANSLLELYDLRGWDSSGRPTVSRLRELQVDGGILSKAREQYDET